MLDQNTDRMWFVIGAVIVGAAIIFIANGTLPDIFASVANSFESVTDKGLGVVEDIGYDIEPKKNYLLDSNAPKTSMNYVDYYLDIDEFNELQGNTVTISFDAKAEDDNHHAIDLYFRVHDGTIRTFNMSDSYIIDKDYVRLTYQMDIPSFDKYLDYKMSLRIRGNTYVPGGIPNAEGIDNAGRFTVRQVKMELGYRDTGYIEHESEQEGGE